MIATVRNINTEFMDKNRKRLVLFEDRIEGHHMGELTCVMYSDHAEFAKYRQIIINSQGYGK